MLGNMLIFTQQVREESGFEPSSPVQECDLNHSLKLPLQSPILFMGKWETIKILPEKPGKCFHFFSF